MRRARSAARIDERTDTSTSPREAVCSSTKSRTFPRPSRQNSSGYYRSTGCNVWEARNVIRQAVVLSSDLIQPTHLAGLFPERSRTPATSPDPTPPDGPSLKQIAETAAAEAESRAIRRTLQATRGKKSEAARLLKVDYKTLHLKMKRYRIYARDFMA